MPCTLLQPRAPLYTPLHPLYRYIEAGQAFHAALERCGVLDRGDKQGLEERSEGWSDRCGEDAAMYCELLCELAEVYSRYEVQPPAGVTPSALLQTALEVASSLQPRAEWEGGGAGEGLWEGSPPSSGREPSSPGRLRASPPSPPSPPSPIREEEAAAGGLPSGDSARPASSPRPPPSLSRASSLPPTKRGATKAAPNMHLAQVLHSTAWAVLKEKGVADRTDAEAIEQHFTRAIELRRRRDNALAAESYNGLGQLYHLQAKATPDPEVAAALWSKAEATLQAALEQRRARPLSAELGQSLAALGALRLDCEVASRGGGGPEAISEAISLLLEATSLYALSLGPFHSRLGYALSSLARGYGMSDLGYGAQHTHRLAVLQRVVHIRSLASQVTGGSQLTSHQLQLTSRELASHGPRASGLASLQGDLDHLDHLDQREQLEQRGGARLRPWRALLTMAPPPQPAASQAQACSQGWSQRWSDLGSSTPRGTGGRASSSGQGVVRGVVTRRPASDVVAGSLSSSPGLSASPGLSSSPGLSASPGAMRRRGSPGHARVGAPLPERRPSGGTVAWGGSSDGGNTPPMAPSAGSSDDNNDPTPLLPPPLLVSVAGSSPSASPCSKRPSATPGGKRPSPVPSHRPSLSPAGLAQERLGQGQASPRLGQAGLVSLGSPRLVSMGRNLFDEAAEAGEAGEAGGEGGTSRAGSQSSSGVGSHAGSQASLSPPKSPSKRGVLAKVVSRRRASSHKAMALSDSREVAAHREGEGVKRVKSREGDAEASSPSPLKQQSKGPWLPTHSRVGGDDAEVGGGLRGRSEVFSMSSMVSKNQGSPTGRESWSIAEHPPGITLPSADGGAEETEEAGEMQEMVGVSFVVPPTAAAGDSVPVEIEGGHAGDHQGDVLLHLKVPAGATPGASAHVSVLASQLLPASQQRTQREPTSPTSPTSPISPTARHRKSFRRHGAEQPQQQAQQAQQAQPRQASHRRATHVGTGIAHLLEEDGEASGEASGEAGWEAGGLGGCKSEPHRRRSDNESHRMSHGRNSRPAASGWGAADAKTAPDEREAWQVEQHAAVEAWCAAVMAGAVEGAAVLQGLELHYPELSYFVGLGVGEDLSLRDDLAARRRGVLGAMRLACWLARPKPLTRAKPIAHGCDIDNDAEPWVASLATAWREEVQSAAHLNVLLSLLALSSLAHVAALMLDVHAGPGRADGSSRHDETRPPRSADVLGGGVSTNLPAAEDAAPQGEAPQGGVALPSLARHRNPQRGLLCALLRASLDLVSFCRGELP